MTAQDEGREWLVQITAPHFCAGLSITDGVCTHAAPILKWAVGKHRNFLSHYFKQKGWTARMLPVAPPTEGPTR